jgi:histidinol-phosphate aminotransferase|tara:strand:- start:14328 stop:15407 length:1080 start_codon:yes stop_codon:yes gene_type:complete
MQFKTHQDKLIRLQTSQNRDLKKGIILDRNERADSYNNSDFKKALNSFSINSFNATPDISLLYKKIAKLHKVKIDNIYITQGITECMSHIIFSTLTKDDEAIVMHPSYPMYDVLLKLHNVKYRLWKFSNTFELKMNDLKKLINKKTKVLFLVNPNMPIEYEFSKKYKNEIYKICKKNNILLVYDEAYHHFGSISEVSKTKKYKNLIVMRTFSKAWGLSGIRLGYMVADKKLSEYISKCRTLVETNSLTYQAALWALKNKIYKDHVKFVKQGSKYIRNKFRSNGDIFHGGKKTNFILLKLSNQKLTKNLVLWLAKRKIYIRANFPKPLEDYVRISLGSSKKLSIFFKEYNKWKKKFINRK